MSSILCSSLGHEIKVSLATSDKKRGAWWVVGSKNQWVDIRVTNSGKIIPFMVHKGRHPFFTLEEAK